jgi:hypothetical protein
MSTALQFPVHLKQYGRVSSNVFLQSSCHRSRYFLESLVVLKKSANDLTRIDASTRTIAVCMPDKQGTRSADWHGFITTIRNVEAATDYDFLSKAPKSLQEILETRRDSSATGPATSNPCQ